MTGLVRKDKDHLPRPVAAPHSLFRGVMDPALSLVLERLREEPFSIHHRRVM